MELTKTGKAKKKKDTNQQFNYVNQIKNLKFKNQLMKYHRETRWFNPRFPQPHCIFSDKIVGQKEKSKLTS